MNHGTLFDAWTKQNQTDARDEKHDGNGRGDLNDLFLVHRGFERANLGHFFLLMIAEVRVDQSHNAADQKNNAKNDHEALHAAPKLPQFNVGLPRKAANTPLR